MPSESPGQSPVSPRCRAWSAAVSESQNRAGQLYGFRVTTTACSPSWRLDWGPGVQGSPGQGPQARAPSRIFQAPWGVLRVDILKRVALRVAPELPGASCKGGCLRPRQGEVSGPAKLGSEVGYNLVNLEKTCFSRWVFLSPLRSQNPKASHLHTPNTG